MAYEDEVYIPPITSDSDFPFDMHDWDLPLSLTLSEAYHLPNINHFITPELRVEGGVVDLINIPKGCVRIDIFDATVTNSKNHIYYTFKEVDISYSIVFRDIKKVFPNAQISILESTWT